MVGIDVEAMEGKSLKMARRRPTRLRVVLETEVEERQRETKGFSVVNFRKGRDWHQKIDLARDKRRRGSDTGKGGNGRWLWSHDRWYALFGRWCLRWRLRDSTE